MEEINALKRILPHSIEAEQAVVGAMLMDKEAILVASETVTGEDFYQKQYGIIFDAMVELYNEGKPVDLVTLQNRLKEKDLIFGASVTVTKENLEEAFSEEFLDTLAVRGCKAVIFVEFVPVTEESKELAPDDDDRAYIRKRMAELRQERDDMVYIASEEAAIRVMAPDIRTVWSPAGGEPVIVKVKEGAF